MTWTIFKGMFRKRVITLTRYAFNTVSQLVTFYIVFCLIFFGAQALGGAVDMGETLEGILVGYFVWMLAIMAYSDLSWHVVNEAQIGTLEQMYLSPAGFHWVNAAYLVSNLIINLFLLAFLLGIMILTTGQRLVLDLLGIGPLLLLTVAPAYGIGMIMGGLALIYKRVQSSFQILQFVFIAFITIPLSRYPLVRFLPLAQGNYMLRQVMIEGQRLWELAGYDLAVAALVAVGYLGLGIAIFRRCEKFARSGGLLGQY